MNLNKQLGGDRRRPSNLNDGKHFRLAELSDLDSAQNWNWELGTGNWELATP